MADTPLNCVDAAMEYANRSEHGGEGFHLRLVLVNGPVLCGPVTQDPKTPDLIGMSVYETNGVSVPDVGSAEEAFICKHHVIAASVVW